jgi:FdhD protein
MSGFRDTLARRIMPEGEESFRRSLPEEVAVAIEYNGIGYAVMMATPSDLRDFAVGFTLSERIVASASEIGEIEADEVIHGWLLRVWIAPERMTAVHERARQRVAESGCGLCGVESLDRLAQPLPRVSHGLLVETSAIFHALSEIPEHQPLNERTGGVHAAAFCDPDGKIRLVREDVGRHNALDKTLGALAKAGLDAGEGFLLLTSRCSFELVEKAVLAGAHTLVTISTATTLASDRARQAGLRLIALARPDAMIELVSSPETHPRH